MEGVQTISTPLSERINDSSATSVGFPTLLFGVGCLAIVIGVLSEPDRRDRNRRERTRSRPGTDVRVIVGAGVLITVVAATAAMLGPAGTVRFSLISTEGPAVDDPLVVQAGGTTTVTHTSRNAGLFPTLVAVESDDNVRIADRTGITGPRGSVKTAVTIEAPSDSGRYNRYVTEHRYLLVLPPRLLMAFHNVHPFAAVAVVNLVIAISILLVSLLYFDRDRLLIRHRERSLPLTLRLWRWLF